ncbi:uncharacterized protein LOC135823103 [Sycon ciliatum]|uniref:uncharacterized protein LOC135823103 n=1 Tax=Sycon ciliatum TaxID=27933 RepID=UPI0031F6130A
MSVAFRSLQRGQLAALQLRCMAQAAKPISESKSPSASGMTNDQCFQLEKLKQLTSVASSLTLNDEEVKIISAPIEEKHLQLREGSMLYISTVHYRVRLNKALGIGGWALIPMGDAEIHGDAKDKLILREFGLFIRGHLVSQAVGEHRVFGPESQGKSLESARSSALKRCCKDLGMYRELHIAQVSSELKHKLLLKKPGQKKRY